MTGVVVEDVTKSFGPVPVLVGIDLSVPAGSFTAVLGPSGSGKTTLLRILAGFERADGGRVSLGGVTVEDRDVHVPPEQRGIGYVPQEAALFPHLTVEANIAFGLHSHWRRRAQGRRRGSRPVEASRQRHHHDRSRHQGRRRRVEELLETVGLSGLGKRFPHQLSGGQQQRVALARALAIKPHVVLLDEPFGSLDAGMRASVRADVRRTLAEAGTTAILVTHDQDEAMSLADHLAVLREGRIAQYGTPRDLYLKPVDEELATFLGSANLLDGVVVPGGGAVDTILGRLLLDRDLGAAEGPVRVLVRPEQLVLHDLTDGLTDGLTDDVTDDDAGPGAGRADPATVARVVGYDFHGHDATIRLATVPRPSGREVLLVARAAGSPRFEHGDEVALSALGPVTAWSAAGGHKT